MIFPDHNGSLARVRRRLTATRFCATMMPGVLASLLLTAAPAHAALSGGSHRQPRSTAAPRVEAAATPARRRGRAQQAGRLHAGAEHLHLRRSLTRLVLLRHRHSGHTRFADAQFADSAADDYGTAPSAGAEVLDSGLASWYGGRRNGMRTSSGTRFDENAMTAAHYWLPLGTRVRVTLDGTDASVLVTITDRQGTTRRAIDLSKEAARQLGILGRGTARVTLTRG